jgi:hypothetical protein
MRAGALEWRAELRRPERRSEVESAEPHALGAPTVRVAERRSLCARCGCERGPRTCREGPLIQCIGLAIDHMGSCGRHPQAAARGAHDVYTSA